MGTDGRRQVWIYTWPREPWGGKPRPPLVLAYLTPQHSDDDPGCLHLVDVWPGLLAKREAVRAHRENCMVTALERHLAWCERRGYTKAIEEARSALERARVEAK